VSLLSPARGYALWAPTYAETAVTALETTIVDGFGVTLAGQRVLDVGCGIARRLREAREAGASTAVGLDLSPEMLARAEDQPLLAAADVGALPVADGTFDVVWCRLVIGYVGAMQRAYIELARACVPGGTVLVTDFHPAAVAAGHRRTFRDSGGELHELESHAHEPDAHLAAAQRAGLSLRERRDGVVGETVRGFYERAGRMDMYERQLGLPLVLALLYVRTG